MFYNNIESPFKKWYIEEVKKLDGASKIAKWFFYASLVVAIFEPIIVSSIPNIIKKPSYESFEYSLNYGSGVEAYSHWNNDPEYRISLGNDQTIFTKKDIKVFVTIYSTLLLICILVLSKRIQDKRTELNKLPEIEESKWPEFLDVIHKIGSDFGIDPSEIKILYSNSLSPSASIMSDQKKINLLVTLGLIILFFKNSEHVKVVIAHEFAHVIHKDSDSWYLLSVWSTVLWNIMLPVHAVLGFMVFIYGLSISCLMLPYPLIITLLARSNILKSRKKSELLADIVAAIYINYSSVYETINTYLRSTNKSHSKSKFNRKWYKVYLTKTRYLVSGTTRIEELKKIKVKCC